VATSEVQNTHPNFSWLGLQICIILNVSCSSGGSFLLAFQFHRSLELVRGSGKKKDWSMWLAFILFIVHTILFAVIGAMLATVTHGYGSLAQLSSVTFVIYRVYISVYFFWGHWEVYKVFKASGGKKKKSSNDAEHIGRRLSIISVANLMCVLLGILFALPVISQNHHGWVLIMWIQIALALTFCLEIGAVPLNSSRQDALQGSSSKNASKVPSSTSPSPNMTGRLTAWISKSTIADAKVQTVNT
jgi:hypothetical protein